MIPFLKKKQNQTELIFLKSLYTQESVFSLQKALGQTLDIKTTPEGFFIDVSSFSDEDCLEILNYCLCYTKKQHL